MSITVNDGGTLRTLSTITVNDAGTLRTLSIVKTNDAGTLRTIYSALPDTISGTYSNSNTGGLKYTLVTSFTLTSSATVTVKQTNISYGSGTSDKVAVANYSTSSSTTSSGTSIISDSSSNPTSQSGSVTLSAGTYYIFFVVGSLTGSSSGTSYYAGSCSYEITFAAA